MKLFSKAIMYITAVAVLSWFLPWLYALCFPAPSSEPFCSFSPVSGKWIVSQASPGQKPIIMELDSISADGTYAGRHITREERDSLVPQLFYKELMAHDRLPDSIGGKEVSVHNLRSSELMFNQSPRDVVKRQAGVWMMMESMPERVELTDADQVFRFTDAGTMEFVDMASNSVNSSRSRRFTEALSRQGFVFPAADLSANVTSRKQYDEGYLMIDAEGKPFHVKQQAGRPYVARIPMPEGCKASKVMIMEENDRSLLGLIADTDSNLYAIAREGYTVLPLPVGKVNPASESILAMGNMFNTTFRFTGNGLTRWRAVERTPEGFRLIGAFDRTAPRTAAAEVADYIFPYTLAFISTSDSLAYPRIGRFSAKALWLNLVLALLLFGINRRRGVRCVGGPALTLALGIYGFIPFLLIHD